MTGFIEAALKLYGVCEVILNISDRVIQEAVDAMHEQRVQISQAWDAYFGNLPKPLKWGALPGGRGRSDRPGTRRGG